jgi:hypothetical protein
MTHLGDVAFDEFPVFGALRRTFLAVPASDFRDMHEHQRQCCRHRQRCGSRHFERSVRCPQPDVCDLVAAHSVAGRLPGGRASIRPLEAVGVAGRGRPR